MLSTPSSSITARRVFMLMLVTFNAGLLLIGGLQAGPERLSASPKAKARARAAPTRTPTIAPSASTPFSENQQLFLPLIYQPLHLYLPLALFENAAPQVSNPFPAQEAARTSLNAYLLWSHTGDPEGDDYHFEVYLEADDETPDELIGETTSQFLEPPFTFELDTRYYWQVVAVDARGAINAGPVWTFSSEDLPYPPPVGEMISIPSHQFLMGCDSGNPFEDRCAYANNHYELPLHLVRLDAFEIDKYEVTNIQYRECEDAGVCNPPRRFDSKYYQHYYDDPAFDYYPVLYVSHWDAEDYCGFVDKRLPTEAEWELAARGSVDTRKWPWGDEPLDCTRAPRKADNGKCVDPQDTQPVGTYPRGASPYGLMDVAGNAFEWVADLYDVLYYTYSPGVNPPGPDFSRTDVRLPPGDEFEFPVFTVRGGSNVGNHFYMRTAHRHWGHWGDKPYSDEPYFRSYRVGFRCAWSIEE